MLVSSFVNTFNLSGAHSFIKQAKALFYGRQLLFFHVPKCGGTSFSHYFRVKYAASQFRLREETSREIVSPEVGEQWMEFKRNLFLYHALEGTSFVQGHVPYAKAAFAPLHKKAIFLTLLREPTDRVVSHYFFDARLRAMSFGEFLASPRGRSECSIYSRFFGELPFTAPSPTPAHRDAAIDALSRFDVVGILEEPEVLQWQLRRRAGVYLSLPKRNVGQQRGEGEPEELARHREQLAELCRFDAEIYQAMRARAREQAEAASAPVRTSALTER